MSILSQDDGEKLSFQLRRKVSKDCELVMSFGRSFEMSGAAALKAVTPVAVLSQ